MRLNCYIDGEYVMGIARVTEENLTDIQKDWLKNPTVIELSLFKCIPEVGSNFDGTSFSIISDLDYNALTINSERQYFALVVDDKVIRVMSFSDEMNCAIMASNPVFKLEGDMSGPVKVATI